MNFYEELINTLKKNGEYVSEDHTLLKNRIVEDAMKLDESLLALLFENENLLIFITSFLFIKRINTITDANSVTKLVSIKPVAAYT